MSEEITPQAPVPEPETEQPDKVPRKGRQRQRQRSVFQYIGVLFAAAFLLLALTYFMERRQNAEALDNLNQTITGLKDSVSAMKSVEELYAENAQLQKDVDTLKIKNKSLENVVSAYQESAAASEKSLQAMDWFWQIDEAYARGKYSLCRSLIRGFEAAVLTESLPTESVTQNGRFSPYDRYQEIYDDVF